MADEGQLESDETLDGRVAVITGAGRNIGAETAVVLAAAGARIVAVDLSVDALTTTKERIEKIAPGRVRAVACDVGDAASVQSMAAQAQGAFGRVDILVNNVATTDRGHSVLDLPEEVWDQVIAVGLTSTFLCSKYVGRHIRDGGRGGVIVNLGSTSAFKGRSNVTAYSASKAGVISLTRSMAVQLAPYSIRVVSVSPNRVGSPVGQDQIPEDRDQRNLVGRVGQPRDIANSIRFLVSDDAEFITGIDLLVDGGAQQAMTL